MHPAKIDALETVIRVLKNGKRLKDYAALEATLQASRALAMAEGHPATGSDGSEVCKGGAGDGACPVCRTVFFIEGALQELNPDPAWAPRVDPEAPRIILPST